MDFRSSGTLGATRSLIFPSLGIKWRPWTCVATVVAPSPARLPPIQFAIWLRMSLPLSISSGVEQPSSLATIGALQSYGIRLICYSASYWSLGAAGSAGRNQRSAPGILERSLGRRLSQEGLPILSACMLMSELGVRRDKAALSSGCKSRPAIAPAGSSRSSYGGDEIAEAFGMRVTNR
jgi:hypothetical protein